MRKIYLINLEYGLIQAIYYLSNSSVEEKEGGGGGNILIVIKFVLRLGLYPLQRDDELERLRREVQRYRLELSNREMSFNRMFTDHKPVIVDAKGRKTSSNLVHDNVSSNSRVDIATNDK